MHENGILKGELKAQGGKLIRCFLTIQDDKINSIKITGDFFLHPEEKIFELEEILTGCQITESLISQRLTKFFKNATLIGASPQDFLNIILLTSRERTK